jgi:hypothetical protein
MPSIRIKRFAGLLTELNPKELQNDYAQIAHNCLLWDGWLRPMPEWSITTYGSSTTLSVYKDSTQTLGYNVNYQLYNVVQNYSQPFNTDCPIGLFNESGISDGIGYLRSYTAPPPFGSITGFYGFTIPTLSGVSQVVTNNNLSVYPISRTYAITYSSNNAEGPPVILPEIGGPLSSVNPGRLFEGDAVALSFGVNLSDITTFNVTHINIYRTVPNFKTSETLGNPLQTGFHLVTTLPAASYIYFVDIAPSENIPGDLLLSDQWMPSPTTIPVGLRRSAFQQTEGGWAVLYQTSAVESTVQFSERYMYHAWPPQNTLNFQEKINSMAVFYDNVFLGTYNGAYNIVVGASDNETISLNARIFPDKYACLPNTMCATNFGAMYASPDGLIALSTEGDTLASKNVANPGDNINTGAATFSFSNILKSEYWNGNYFGFSNNAALVFNQHNQANKEFPLSSMVTIDVPSSFPGPSVVTGSGMFMSFGNNVFTLPLPGYGYQSATKATYRWKSKRYVMPGLTTFAACKVVNDESGTLTVTINGYNKGGEANPEFVYTRTLNHSNPFRIPHQHKCLEWEILLSGTSVVQEVHLATSERELTEEVGHG